MEFAMVLLDYLWIFILAIFVIVVIIKIAIIVPNKYEIVVERLGKYNTTLTSGFHIIVPFIDRMAYKRCLKEEVLDVPEQTCITKDNVSVAIDGFLYLRVEDSQKSAYGIHDYKYGAVQLAQTALRSVIGTLELDKTFEERDSINAKVVEALDKATSSWGVKVLRYELRDIKPPTSILEAMEKQMRAEREKRAAVAQSLGEKESMENVANGEKAATIARSEGDMQAIKNRAEAEAAQITAIAKATADGLEMIAKQMSTTEGTLAANLRIAENYIEQFGNLAKANNTLIIPANVGDVSGMVATMMQTITTTK